MTFAGSRAVKHLGTLRGRGTLLNGEGRLLNDVTYEIDGYLERRSRSANGQIEAENGVLEPSGPTEGMVLVLENGRCVRIVMSDPSDGAAEIRVTGEFPL